MPNDDTNPDEEHTAPEHHHHGGDGQPPEPPRRHSYRVPPKPGSWGAFLRAERDKRSWTQTELGAIANIPQSKISAYERGENKAPDPLALQRLDRAFGFPDGTFLSKAGIPWPSAKEMYARIPEPPAIVIKKPTPELEELVEVIGNVPEDERTSLIESLIRNVQYERTTHFPDYQPETAEEPAAEAGAEPDDEADASRRNPGSA